MPPGDVHHLEALAAQIPDGARVALPPIRASTLALTEVPWLALLPWEVPLLAPWVAPAERPALRPTLKAPPALC